MVVQLVVVVMLVVVKLVVRGRGGRNGARTGIRLTGFRVNFQVFSRKKSCSSKPGVEEIDGSGSAVHRSLVCRGGGG